MPTVAQRILLKRLRDSGNWEEAQRTFHVTTGKTLVFRPTLEAEPESRGRGLARSGAAAELEVASVHMGFLSIEEKVEAVRLEAFRSLLQIIAESLSERLFRETRDHHPILPQKVRLAVSYLQNHYKEPLGLHEVATRVGLSDERLSRLFHESLGVTFSEYLNRLRLDHCRKALQVSRDSITDIAFDAGYQSISQFNRRFRAAEGMTPRAYRASVK